MQQGRRFSETAPQQIVHRFPQNQPQQGWQPQSIQPLPQPTDPEAEKPRKKKRRKRHRFSLLWNLFALVGIGTILVQLARYVVIPLLVWVQSLTGGAV